jgi:asparagine synthase (glutamine-hydrolysing)
MCGIFGSVGYTPDQARIDVVAHRGPDGRGWQVFESASGPVALGHRRLAIIDMTEAGLQPMFDATQRYSLVFNGEIYNYIELREELRAEGCVFTSASDSEVLLVALIKWGPATLKRLRGMFAFLFWDSRDQKLFAARDRFGIKPLYLTESSGGVAFASEIKQLLDLPGVERRMNIPRAHDFLASGMTDHTSETLFIGVVQVRGGECVTVDASGSRPVVTVRRWYTNTVSDLRLTEREAVERFRELLVDAVRIHLRADVTVGSCLSGGLDSSSIVCLMSQKLGGTAAINTVSACYAEKSVDEKPYMDQVVAASHSRPHFVYPRADDVFTKASEITWHQDEPFGSTSIIAQWCVFEAARRAGVKVMLDGQGADEQLAGYHPAFRYYTAGLARRGQLVQLARTIGERRQWHGTPVGSQLAHLLVALLPPNASPWLRGRHRAFMEHDWLGTDLLREHGNPAGALASASRSMALPPVTDLRSLCMTLTYASNLQMLLHWEDRNSMAHAVEARVPFLDHPLVEFSLALGNDHKIVGGDTKRVLRQAMAGVLPESVRQRRDKLGFATPEQIWFRGPLRETVQAGIEATLRRYPDLFNAEGVRTLADDMLSGRRNLDFTLWRIISLGIWGQRFSVSI